MPCFNQMGPMGQGPLTGRRMGRCTNFGANASSEKSGSDRQSSEKSSAQPYGPGRGMGMGWRRGGLGFGIGRQNRFRGNF